MTNLRACWPYLPSVITNASNEFEISLFHLKLNNTVRICFCYFIHVETTRTTQPITLFRCVPFRPASLSGALSWNTEKCQAKYRTECMRSRSILLGSKYPKCSGLRVAWACLRGGYLFRDPDVLASRGEWRVIGHLRLATHTYTCCPCEPQLTAKSAFVSLWPFRKHMPLRS